MTRACDSDACTAEERCGYCVDGEHSEVVSDLPEVNLSNSNARALLLLLGLEDDLLVGELAPGDTPAIRQKILRLRNSARARASAVRAPVSDSRFHEGGLDDEGVLERLERLDDLLARAQQRGWSIEWG